MLHWSRADTALPGPKLMLATLSSVGAGGLEGSEGGGDAVNVCSSQSNTEIQSPQKLLEQQGQFLMLYTENTAVLGFLFTVRVSE